MTKIRVVLHKTVVKTTLYEGVFEYDVSDELAAKIAAGDPAIDDWARYTVPALIKDWTVLKEEGPEVVNMRVASIGTEET